MNRTHDIRGRYAEIINAISKNYEPVYTTPEYRIHPDATFAQCLEYTQKYVVGGEDDTPHHRYDAYRDALREVFVGLRRSERRPLVHVDVGCGPGLFTWVVWDYFRDTYSKIGLELYGYDHSPRMVKLANLIWNRLGISTSYSCHHRLEALYSTAMQGGPVPCGVLITFGHVLVQTVDDESAVSDFADIVDTFVMIGDCQILAVDAYSTLSRRETFRKACENLRVAIEQRGMVVVEWDIPTFGSRMFARIGTRSEI